MTFSMGEMRQELGESKRQREKSSAESAEYSSLLESQLETSNVNICVGLCGRMVVLQSRCV